MDLEKSKYVEKVLDHFPLNNLFLVGLGTSHVLFSITNNHQSTYYPIKISAIFSRLKLIILRRFSIFMGMGFFLIQFFLASNSQYLSRQTCI